MISIDLPSRLEGHQVTRTAGRTSPSGVWTVLRASVVARRAVAPAHQMSGWPACPSDREVEGFSTAAMAASSAWIYGKGNFSALIHPPSDHGDTDGSTSPLGVVDERSAASDLCARLIFAVELVDVLDELAVQKVKRDVLRAYSRALSAVGASSGDVERADDVEHLILEGVCGRLVRQRRTPGCRTRTSRRYTPGRHCGTRCSGCSLESSPCQNAKRSSGVIASSFSTSSKRFESMTSSVLAEKLVISDVLLGLAVKASVRQNVASRRLSRLRHRECER